MMKKVVLVLFLILSNLSTAQVNPDDDSANVLPIEEFHNRSTISGEKNGFYFKDLNNLFGSYLGVWQWENGNQELTFYLYKDEEVPVTYGDTNNPNVHYSTDIIFGYYIYKENGIELINTRPILVENIEDRQYESRGGCGMIPTDNGYNSESAPSFFFVDYSRRICRDGEELPVTGRSGYWRFEDSTTAQLGLYTAGPQYTNCPIQVLFPNFPVNDGITVIRIAEVAPPL